MYLQWLSNYIPKDLLIEMGNTSHSAKDGTLSPYHQEGSVLSHTLLVLQSLQHFQDNVSESELLSVLYHDIGKTKAQFYKNDDASCTPTFWGHEGLSFFMAMDMPHKIELAHLKFIAQHGDHWKYNTRKSGVWSNHPTDKNFMEAVQRFSKFDRDGSISAETRNGYENGTAFELTEYVDNGAKIGVNKTLDILIGPSGSGKSTLVEEALKEYDGKAVVISRDDVLMELVPGETYNEKWQNQKGYKVDEVVMKRFIEACKDDSVRRIIIDQTNLTIKRTKWIKEFKRHVPDGAVVACVFFNSYNTLLERVQNRPGKSISEDVLITQMKSFEYPKYNEGYNKIIVGGSYFDE